MTKWLEALMNREIELWGLPPSVAAFYHAGFAEGRASRQHEIDALEREVQRLHYLAFMPANERRTMLLDRLNNGLATANEEQWQQLEKDLHQAAGKTLDTGKPGIEVDHDGRSTRERKAA